MARMIERVDVLRNWKEQEEESYEVGYNFAMLEIAKKGEWVTGTLMDIVAMNKDDGNYGEFDKGVEEAVRDWKKGRKGND